MDSLYSAIISKAILKHSLDLSRLHFDTTSLSLYGEYKTDDENPLAALGFSKQDRPDLKQVLFGMTVTQDGDFQLLLTKEGRRKGTFEEYRGYSVIRPYVYETEDGKKVERTMRFLVVESTTLEKKKGKKIDIGISAEEEELIETADNLKKECFPAKKNKISAYF